jgi:hypothetical protein
VEEAWTVVLSGRIPAQTVGETVTDNITRTVARWKDRQSAEAIGSPLHALLTELLDRLARGDSVLDLDQLLEERLAEAAPGPILLEIEQEVEVELAEFRGKMPPPALERTKAQAILNRLRSELDLPKLPCSP